MNTRNQSPDAEIQRLIETLDRAGVLSEQLRAGHRINRTVWRNTLAALYLDYDRTTNDLIFGQRSAADIAKFKELFRIYDRFLKRGRRTPGRAMVAALRQTIAEKSPNGAANAPE